MTLQIPNPVTLRDAITEVIRQNSEVGYRATRFSQATLGGNAVNIVPVCNDMIQAHHTLDVLHEAVVKFADLLTLEDLVFRSLNGRDWELDESTIVYAEARVELLDKQVGYQRWSNLPEAHTNAYRQ